jgi:hypothetical protein
MNTVLKKSSHDARFIIKTALAYCILSMTFSFAGILLAEKGPIPNPVGSLTVQEVIGHVIWGLVAGAATLSLRYTILTGLFAVIIDSDHIIGLTHLDALLRMSHSIAFGLLSTIVLLVVFGKKNYLLASAAMSGLLAHLSFDTFADNIGRFPIFTPFYNHQVSFPHVDWIYFELIAVTIMGIVTILQKKKNHHFNL